MIKGSREGHSYYINFARKPLVKSIIEKKGEINGYTTKIVAPPMIYRYMQRVIKMVGKIQKWWAKAFSNPAPCEDHKGMLGFTIAAF